jgi:CHAT domain-containing protein
MRPGLMFLIVGLLGLSMAACQETVSVDEAKRITTKFSGTQAVPKKRTNADVTSVLDKQKASRAGKTTQHRKNLAETVPQSSDPTDQVRFHLKRGRAAAKLGKNELALVEFRQAARLMKSAKLSDKERHNLLRSLAWAEASAGNYLKGVRIMEKAVDVLPSPVALRSLVRLYVVAGNFDAAEKAYMRGKRLIGQIIDRSRNMPPAKRAKLEIEEARMEREILEAQGRWGKAEPWLRKYIDLFEKSGGEAANPSYLPLQKAELARNLMKQGRLPEAEVVAREALLRSLSILGRDNATTADVARKLAEVLYAQRRDADAEKLIRTVIDIHKKIGSRSDTRKLVLARHLLGMILVAQEDWAGAMDEFDGVRADLGENPSLFLKIFGQSPALTTALIQNGRSQEALELLPRFYEKAKKRVGKKHFGTARLGGLLAMAHADVGNLREALTLFRDSVPILLTRSRQSDDETSDGTAREAWLLRILEGYVELLADVRGTPMETEFGIDAASEAFRIADAARNRALQRAVAASGVRALAGTPELADLVRREQDAQKQVSALYAVLADVLSAPTDQQDAAAVTDLRTRIDALRGARAALMNDIETRFPDYASLLNPKADTIEEARRVLRPGEALITTLIGTRRSFVWAVPFKGEARFVAPDLGREDVQDLVGLIRSSLEPNAKTLGEIPPFDVEMAYSLYEELFLPVADGWRDADSLLVVAHGPLGYLPLSLLPTKPVLLGEEGGALFSNHRRIPWLVRTHAVTMVPSVASLRTLRNLPPGRADRREFAGFGDPIFGDQDSPVQSSAADVSPAVATRGLPVHLRAAPKTADLEKPGLGDLPRLADTADEIRSIALALNADLTRDVFTGATASEKTVKSLDLSGYRVLAFATHGLVPGDLDGLSQPALALSAQTDDVGGEDGLLTMGEILSLRLDADWVVLSACNTGAGRGAGAEAVSGLGRAFFYAGTRAILVSNWPVETTSARLLTTDVFRRQANEPGLARAQALRQAMVSLIDGRGFVDAEGRIVFSYAHPIFWAPFTLIGDGGAFVPTG